MSSNKIKAGSAFPPITVPLLGGETAELGRPGEGYDWRMVVVYRGRHCPLCTRYLNQLESIRGELQQLGIDVIGVSADNLEQLTAHAGELQVGYSLAYGLSVEQMRSLGLYISEPRSEQETDHLFAEPGLFVVNEQGRVQLADISNAPFARPELTVMLSGLGFIRKPENNYPIRGTVG